MSVSDILEETKNWAPHQVDALVTALKQKPCRETDEKTVAQRLEALREFQKQIDAIWAGTDIEVSNEQIVALIRESRGRG